MVIPVKLQYTKVKSNSSNHPIFEHIKVWEQFHGSRRPNYQIHHIDGNPKNNSITNLVELKKEYHLTYHKLAKILGKTIKQMNVHIGMQPADTPIFYAKIDELARTLHTDVNAESFAARRKTGSGLNKNEAMKRKMIDTGKKRILAGQPAYMRNTKEDTEKAKQNAKKYFGSLQAYNDACK